jgi:putative transcriptional regulator
MDMKQLRLKVKLRTVDVASRVGIAESSVRNWEKGRTIPKLTIDKTAVLCQLYRCSIEDLATAAQESISTAAQGGDLDLDEVSDSPDSE